MKKCIITAIQLSLVWHATTGSFHPRSETAIKSCSSSTNHHPLTIVPSGGGGESTIEETSSYTLTGTATDDIEIDHVPHRFEPRRIILPLQVIVGAAMMYVAVRLVQTIYPSPMQETITSGSATGISTFYMWQTTVSLSMVKQTKYNHPLFVGMYTLGSLLLMNTRRGMDAMVPIIQGLDNLEGAGAILPSSPIVGWEQMLRIARALPGFCVCQIIRLVLPFIALVRSSKWNS